MTKPKPAVTIQTQLLNVGNRLRPYTLLFFLLFVALLYGFVLLRIDSLSGAQPSQDAVNSQIKTSQLPRIDPSVVDKIQSLRDHSVNVRSLFNQARSNPFQ